MDINDGECGSEQPASGLYRVHWHRRTNPEGFPDLVDVKVEDLVVGKKYFYSRPSWDTSSSITVEEGQGDFAGQKMIRFRPGYYPSKLTDLPADARFQEVIFQKMA